MARRPYRRKRPADGPPCPAREPEVPDGREQRHGAPQSRSRGRARGPGAVALEPADLLHHEVEREWNRPLPGAPARPLDLDRLAGVHRPRSGTRRWSRSRSARRRRAAATPRLTKRPRSVGGPGIQRVSPVLVTRRRTGRAPTAPASRVARAAAAPGGTRASGGPAVRPPLDDEVDVDRGGPALLEPRTFSSTRSSRST